MKISKDPERIRSSEKFQATEDPSLSDVLNIIERMI